MINVVSYSGIGNRESNQDTIVTHTMRDGGIYIIADGMGGYEAGEKASYIAAHIIDAYLSKDQSLKQAAAAANKEIQKTAWELNVQRIGTCVAGVRINGFSANCFWIGDSRVYLFREGKEIFRTQDHSPLAALEKSGHISDELRARYAHVVSRALMGGEKDLLDECPLNLKAGDEIIVCSDGLYKTWSAKCLLDMIHHGKYEDFSAYNASFSDNYSFIYLKVE